MNRFQKALDKWAHPGETPQQRDYRRWRDRLTQETGMQPVFRPEVREGGPWSQAPRQMARKVAEQEQALDMLPPELAAVLEEAFKGPLVGARIVAINGRPVPESRAQQLGRERVERAAGSRWQPSPEPPAESGLTHDEAHMLDLYRRMVAESGFTEPRDVLVMALPFPAVTGALLSDEARIELGLAASKAMMDRLPELLPEGHKA